MPKDPICNMEVNEKKTKWKSVYEGQTYYFCCPVCKEEFESNPRKHLMTD